MTSARGLTAEDASALMDESIRAARSGAFIGFEAVGEDSYDSVWVRAALTHDGLYVVLAIDVKSGGKGRKVLIRRDDLFRATQSGA